MGRFEDLHVWQKGVELASEIYSLTRDKELGKDFGLKDQMRRAATSISSNIAEGDELDTQKQSLRHFYIAKGSCAELYTQIIIAEKAGYLGPEKSLHIKSKCKEISKMLSGLIVARKRNLEP